MSRPHDEMALTAYRRPGTWVDGDWTPTPGETIPIPFVGGRPQPAGPEVIDMLPAGARSIARFVMWVHDDQPVLQTIDDDGTTAADYMTWDGEIHVLVSIEDWAGVALGHHVYGLIRVAPDEVLP